MANEFAGWQKYAVLTPETTWGVYAGGGTKIFVPYTENSVQTVQAFTQVPLVLGVRQRRHNVPAGNTVTGNLAMPLYGAHVASKSIAQWLIEWALNGPASIFLDSFSLDTFEAGVDNKLHTGLRVQSMTLSGDADSNQVNISLSLQGKDEQGGVTSPVLSATTPQPVGFTFDQVQLFLSNESEGESATAEAESISIRSFNLTVTNTLTPYRTNSLYPTLVTAGVRTVDFSFTAFKNANTYDVFRRSSTLVNRAAHLVLRGQHLGTGASGTKTRVDLYFDRLNFAGSQDGGGINDVITVTPNWLALKPSTSSNEVAASFSLEA